MQGKEIQNKKAAAKTSSIYLHKKLSLLLPYQF